ncbi:MAG: Periplasmic protein TonB-like protein [Chlamydiales bacterium]|jgi:hypothetical protein|nr:Periplasmic protein TonB-like protein [Chlamydiales bacterium]
MNPLKDVSRTTANLFGYTTTVSSSNLGINNFLDNDSIQETEECSSLQNSLRAPQSNLSVKVLVVSSCLEDKKRLIEAATPDVVLIEYDWEKETLTSLYKIIKQRLIGKIASNIAFITHGQAGSVDLLKEHKLTANNMHQVPIERFWNSVGQLVEEGGTIDLPSCNLASSINGQALVNHLKRITKRKIGASNNITGNNSVGGDWWMETDGEDISHKYFDLTALQKWRGKLLITSSSYKTSEGYTFQTLTGNGAAADYIRDLIEDMHTLSTLSKSRTTFRDENNNLITSTNDPRFLNIKSITDTFNTIKTTINDYLTVRTAADLGMTNTSFTRLKQYLTSLDTLLGTLDLGASLPGNAISYMTTNEQFFESGKGNNLVSNAVTNLIKYSNDIVNWIVDVGSAKIISKPNELYSLRSLIESSFLTINAKVGKIGNDVAQRDLAIRTLNQLYSLFSQDWRCDDYNSLLGITGVDSNGQPQYTLLGQAYFSTNPSHYAHYGLAMAAKNGIINTPGFAGLHKITARYVEVTISNTVTSANTGGKNLDLSNTLPSNVLQEISKLAYGGITTSSLWSPYGSPYYEAYYTSDLKNFNSDRSDIDITNIKVGDKIWVPVQPSLSPVFPFNYYDTAHRSKLEQLIDTLYGLKNGGILESILSTDAMNKLNTLLDQAQRALPGPNAEDLTNSLLSLTHPLFLDNPDTSKSPNVSLYTSPRENEDPISSSVKISVNNLVTENDRAGGHPKVDGTTSAGPDYFVRDYGAPEAKGIGDLATPYAIKYTTISWYRDLYNATRWWEGASLQNATASTPKWLNDVDGDQSSRALAQELLRELSSFNENAIQDIQTQVMLFQDLIKANKQILDVFKNITKKLSKQI